MLLHSPGLCHDPNFKLSSGLLEMHPSLLPRVEVSLVSKIFREGKQFRRLIPSMVLPQLCVNPNYKLS